MKTQKPISMSQELRESISKYQTSDTLKNHIHVDIKELLGILSTEMKDIIIDDISAMIKKGYIKSMEGYIFCLSRIINHEIAWTCITTAFSHNNENIPKKYYKHFGKNLPNETLK